MIRVYFFIFEDNFGLLDKNAFVSLENLQLLFDELMNDVCLIGKVPDCVYEEVFFFHNICSNNS